MTVDPQSRIGRIAQRISLSPAFRRVGPVVVPRLDKALHRLTGGRLMIGQAMLPMVILEHTGARTGLPRRTPLAAMPEDGGFWLVGSNYGRPGHPAWTANLLAHPDAAVVHRRRRIPVRARLVEEPERSRVWPRLTAFWPGYEGYARLNDPASPNGRVLRVFRLDPVE
ncbi:MAG: nitroreductase family deazaflavin-dependent oxidoreductase [Frankia sp.]|nr:nitroreductase family deazaflavin-dependent oxidoreductase [Frankia sp.]